MTLQQLRTAVEVEKTGSITKSAANLFLSQPNLSMALKDLEAEIGITVFSRSSRGMEITSEGAEFLAYAKSIIAQMDKLEFIFKNPQKNAVSLTVACVRSSQVSKVFCDFYNQLPKDAPIQLWMQETSPEGVLQALVDSKADIGRIVFAEEECFSIKAKAKKHRLIMELLWKVKPYILVSAKSPLAKQKILSREHLKNFTQLVYSDIQFQDGNFINKELEETLSQRKLHVSERSTAMDVLRNCNDCYLWTTSTHPDILKMYNLVALPCEESTPVIEAMLYPKDRPLSKEMQSMMENLRSVEYHESFLYQEPFQKQTLL